MARSSIAVLPEELRLAIRQQKKTGANLASITHWLQTKHQKTISPSALSRWFNNEKAQAFLDRTESMVDVMESFSSTGAVSDEQMLNLYRNMAACHLSQRAGDSGMETSEVVALGRIIVQLRGMQPTPDEGEVAERSPRDVVEEARKMVTGGR